MEDVGVSDDGNHMQIKAIRTGSSVVDNTTTKLDGIKSYF
jgi:hypothetical protein